jgi:hypothetical protein
MIQRLRPLARRLDKDFHLLADRRLTRIFIQPLWPNSTVYGLFIRRFIVSIDQTIVHID